MTTESVLEKLKRFRHLDINGYTLSHDELNEYFDILSDTIPRLIAALELVEAKAKEVTSYDVWGGVPQEPKVDFAREVLAVVNGETKGE